MPLACCSAKFLCEPSAMLHHLCPFTSVSLLTVPMLLELTTLLLLLVLLLCSTTTNPIAQVVRWLRRSPMVAGPCMIPCVVSGIPAGSRIPQRWQELLSAGRWHAQRRIADPPFDSNWLRLGTTKSEILGYFDSRPFRFVGKWSTSAYCARALTYNEVYRDIHP